MADAKDTLALLQEVANRGVQARLEPNQLIIFNELLNRGAITLPGQDDDEQLDTFQFFERTLGQQIFGTGEMLATMLTGALTEPIAGLAGITEGVAALVAGDEDPLLRASERVQRVREVGLTGAGGTFIPKTEAGRESLQAIAAPIEALFKRVVTPVAQRVGDVTGSPLAATIVQTAAETFPPGLRPRPRAVARRRAGQQRLGELERNTGVTLDNPIELQTEQLGARAVELTEGQVSRAANFDQVQGSLMAAKEIAKQNTNTLYTIARETQAAIPREFITILNDSIHEAIGDFDVTDFRNKVMPNRVNLNNRLKELEALVNSDASPDVQLNELSSFRQRLNRNQGVDASERFALGKVKGVLDSFLDDMFNADMVSGDPAAIQRWKDANRAFADYKKTFSDNKVIAKLTEIEADPNQIKNWIMGANAVGAKTNSAQVINSIGDIIGRDSPQFSAIRQEVLFDVMEPLLRDEPNLKAFINNYDKFVRNNGKLADSVFPESKAALKDLRDMAKAASGVFTTRFQLNLTQTMARAFFGHALSKGQVRINIATQLLGFIASAGTTRSRQISARVLGYDLRAPVLPISPLIGIGALQTLGEPTESQQQLLQNQLQAIQ